MKIKLIRDEVVNSVFAFDSQSVRERTLAEVSPIIADHVMWGIQVPADFANFTNIITNGVHNKV